MMMAGNVAGERLCLSELSIEALILFFAFHAPVCGALSGLGTPYNSLVDSFTLHIGFL
jgi:hypothetical protein